MEEKLIEFVRKNDFLFNKKHKNYKNVYLRNKAFDELSKQLNVPAKKLKDRWRTLRDKYLKELKQQHLNSGSDASCPKKQWKWMDNLMFLKDARIANSNIYGNNSMEGFMNNQQHASADSFEVQCARISPEPCYPEFDNEFVDADIVANQPSTKRKTAKMARGARISPEPCYPEFDNEFVDAGIVANQTSTKKKTEEIAREVNNGMSQVMTMAKEVFAVPTERKTAAQYFFDCLARQTDDAKFSAIEFSHLQMEMLFTFNKVLLEREKNQN